MRQTYVLAATVAALLSVISYNAQALPAAPATSGYGAPQLTLVEGGCGAGFHRGPAGGCRPNEGAVVVAPGVPLVTPPVVVVEPRACPPGFRWGPRVGRCVVN
jgi:hypothetical protein